MKDYFEDKGTVLDNICELCKWMDVVNGDESPCKYCESYGQEDEPEDFDYQKLKEEKLK